MKWLFNGYNSSISSSFNLSPSLYILPVLSLRSDLKTSLRRVSGPRQRRGNLKTMSSLPNSRWPSPHRQRVSVLYVFTPAVTMLCFTVMSDVFLCVSPLPRPPPLSPIPCLFESSCFHQPLKVRVSCTHFHLVVLSQSLSRLSQPSLPRLGGHAAHLHYSGTLCQKSFSHTFMNKPPTPVFVYVLIFSTRPGLVVRDRVPGEMN